MALHGGVGPYAFGLTGVWREETNAEVFDYFSETLISEAEKLDIDSNHVDIFQSNGERGSNLWRLQFPDDAGFGRETNREANFLSYICGIW